jgi:hypothetical protein
MSVLKYKLTQSQYDRFVLDPETTHEIYTLGKPIGVFVSGDTENDWTFTGTIQGTAGLRKVDSDWYCFVNITKKPWYLPIFLLDLAFKAALK